MKKEPAEFPPPALRPLKRVNVSADRLQVHCSSFATAVDLELEFEPVALVEGRNASPLNGRNVDERVGLAVIALNETEALHRVEELDRSARFLAGQLTLGAAVAAGGPAAAA